MDIPATGYIEPAFIHGKRIHHIGVPLVDSLGQLEVFEILVVLRRHDDEVKTVLFRLPVDHPGLYTGFPLRLGSIIVSTNA